MISDCLPSPAAHSSSSSSQVPHSLPPFLSLLLQWLALSRLSSPQSSTSSFSPASPGSASTRSLVFRLPSAASSQSLSQPALTHHNQLQTAHTHQQALLLLRTLVEVCSGARESASVGARRDAAQAAAQVRVTIPATRFFAREIITLFHSYQNVISSETHFES